MIDKRLPSDLSSKPLRVEGRGESLIYRPSNMDDSLLPKLSIIYVKDEIIEPYLQTVKHRGFFAAKAIIDADNEIVLKNQALEGRS